MVSPGKSVQRSPTRWWRACLVLSASWVMASAASAAAPAQSLLLEESAVPAPDVFAHATVIDEQALGDLRGGFTVSGLELDFGATLRTVIDNVRLETVLNLSETGARVVSQTLSDTQQALDSTTDRAQRITLVGPGTGASVVEVSPEGIDIPGLANFSGAVINDAKGFTAALHNITREAILSTVVSNASNQDIRHELDLRLDISNVEAVRAAQLRSRITQSLAR